MQSINIRFENGKVNIIVDGALFKDVHSLSLDYIKGAPMLFSCALTFPHQGKQLHFEAMPAWAEGEFPSDSL